MIGFISEKLHSLRWYALFVPFATLATFFIAAAISFLWQYYRNRHALTLIGFIKHCFPFEGWNSRSGRIDVVMYFAGKLIRGILSLGDAIVLVVLAGGVSFLLNRLMPGHEAGHAGFAILVLWSVVLFISADFANFMTHFLQHKFAFLWELHKVHHSATFLSPLTTARMHPLGDKLDHLGASVLVSVPAGIAMFIHHLNVLDLLVLLANVNMIGTMLVLDALRHSQFPVSFGKFDRVLMSPHMHHLHHSDKYEHWDCNLGNKLSIWDWMFGTAIIPDKNEPISYGIGRGPEMDEQYHSLYGAYIGPVVGMVRVLAGLTPPLEGPPVPITHLQEKLRIAPSVSSSQHDEMDLCEADVAADL